MIVLVLFSGRGIFVDVDSGGAAWGADVHVV